MPRRTDGTAWRPLLFRLPSGERLRAIRCSDSLTAERLTRATASPAAISCKSGHLGRSACRCRSWWRRRSRGWSSKEHDDRSVIMIFNLGAPSQMDTFDPKPEAAAEIRGPFAPISTKGGFQITEILPRHAQVADKFSVVRSCYHTAAAVHDTGHQMLQTGRLFTGGVNTPHVGCALAYLRGPKTRLAAARDPARGDGADRRQPAARAGRGVSGQGVRSVRAEHRSERSRISRCPICCRRRSWAMCGWSGAAGCGRSSKSTWREFEASPSAKLMDANFESAWRMMTSPQARAAFDLSQGAEGSPREVRPESLRPVLLARAAADRGGRAVRHGQHVPDRVQRDHVGHSRQQAVHQHRGNEGHRRADVRPGVWRR